MVENQYYLPIKVIQSYNGGKYLNVVLSQFFQEHDILHETTCPQTLQQNVVAKCKNKHISETTRAHLTGADVPHSYWTDVVTYSVFLMNRIPSRVHNFCTPMEVFANHVTLPSSLQLSPQIFGVHGLCAPSQKSTKQIEPVRSSMCVFGI